MWEWAIFAMCWNYLGSTHRTRLRSLRGVWQNNWILWIISSWWRRSVMPFITKSFSRVFFVMSEVCSGKQSVASNGARYQRHHLSTETKLPKSTFQNYLLKTQHYFKTFIHFFVICVKLNNLKTT